MSPHLLWNIWSRYVIEKSLTFYYLRFLYCIDIVAGIFYLLKTTKSKVCWDKKKGKKLNQKYAEILSKLITSTFWRISHCLPGDFTNLPHAINLIGRLIDL